MSPFALIHPPHLDGRKRVCFVVVLARRESGAILMQRSDVISAGKGKCGRGGLDPEKKAPPPQGSLNESMVDVISPCPLPPGVNGFEERVVELFTKPKPTITFCSGSPTNTHLIPPNRPNPTEFFPGLWFVVFQNHQIPPKCHPKVQKPLGLKRLTHDAPHPEGGGSSGSNPPPTLKNPPGA